LRASVEAEYRERTPASRAMHARAQQYLPGGDTRTGVGFAPYPTYIESAQGCYLYDLDGNALLDLNNNASSLVHGHAHPAIVSAVQAQAARGTGWLAPSPLQVELARALCERVPSLEQVRFCSSGTEANMQAVKAARAFTGRDRILKMAGAYHGTYDGLELNGHGAAGVPRSTADTLTTAPFDDAAGAERLIEQHRDDLAAVIVTPVYTRGGLTPPSPGYLAALREATRAHGVLLIFDEVITFRLARGGAQALYGVVPDLTALGKVIGGGLPVGAFGGRADVMRLYANGAAPGLTHAGTFNANPLTMAAGLEALELLTEPALLRLAELGGRLADRLAAVLAARELPFQVRRVESLVSMDAFTAQTDDTAAEVLRLARLSLLNRGISMPGLCAVSTVMSEEAIDHVADALEKILSMFDGVLA
ncbi:MAG: aminotransferase class III-fold pyridoxal phosphate-dependent enzyme, partial [Chloroflexota bacterium]|nr:aminotransferase class III-fold pyridoxal phosphate-dependent enzyme [Chloroflexota bacterium]